MDYLSLSIIGLIFSFIYSSAEISLISSNPMQIQVWKEQKKIFAKNALTILEKKQSYLTIILIGTNLANVIFTSFTTLFFIQYNVIPTELIFLIVALLILFLGEIIPKTLISEYPNHALIILTPILIISHILCKPIFILTNRLQWLNSINKKHMTAIENKRIDIQHLYEQVVDDKTIEKEQKEIISNIFSFSKKTVSQVMTPKDDISAVEKNDSLEHALHVFIDSGHSKLPIYEGNIDNIIGVIYLYDLFHGPKDLQSIIKTVSFIPHNQLITDLKNEFQSSEHNLAIILDQYGHINGLITAEDIFEELFGDFEDEFDFSSNKIQYLNDGSIIIDASIKIIAFNHNVSQAIPLGNYETLAGYIINETGRIPKKNEHLFLSIGQIIIKNATSRRIRQVQVYLNS